MQLQKLIYKENYTKFNSLLWIAVVTVDAATHKCTDSLLVERVG